MRFAHQRLARQWMLISAALLLTTTPAMAEIRIGVAGVLTGEISWIGEQQEIGARRAVDDINAAGGLLGEQVELVVLDDQCDPELAVAVANQMIEEGVVFVNGHTCSGSSLATAPLYKDAGIVQISPTSTTPELTELGYDHFYRVCGRDDVQGAIAGEFLFNRFSDKTIGVVHDNQAYGKGLAGQTAKALEERGVKVALYEGFEPAQADYTSLVDNIEKSKVEVLYAGSYQSDASIILTQAAERGIELQLVAGDSLASDDFLVYTGDSGIGTLFTFGPDAAKLSSAETVAERIREEDGFEPNGYTLYSYAAVQVWANAVKVAGSTDVDKLSVAMRSETFDTVLGTLGFDDKGDVTGIESYIWYVWGEETYGPLQ